ncbi:hypothetical protein FNV43_RR23509 [Rhamnella rubrinervis]|uniref:glutathione transferase n=1 Tax=Rhamnella rubrinervis TaxID=2594499 RepID=A0A8K0E3Y3_9ROSA|nr:hypothetical protein FNV43_RR23509 [Rhamnella rubrinervis]
MVLKLHGLPMSICTATVMTCLHEKGVDFELVPVDLFAAENKQPSFLAKNPFGQVPAFEDGDLKLFESRAITQYVAQEYADKGTNLVYQDSKKGAILLVWKEVEAHQFDPAASKLSWELAYKPFFGITTDQAVAEENEAKLGKFLDVYETRLSKFKYLAGDCFTLADLHHLPCLHYLMGTRVKELFQSRPHVSAWVADITARPAWSKVVAMTKQN